MSVVIVDHGLCNVGSARRAFEECGGQVLVSDDPSDLREASHIVLPGVGAFAAGMRELQARGWDTALRKAVRDDHIPILGICLGMQLLAEKGYEGGESEGLGLVPGQVIKMEPGKGERLPHVGWNDVAIEKPSVLFQSIPTGTDFYFVHSFHLATTDGDDQVASAPCCGRIAAAVERGRVFGVQFHPEKSSKAGFQLIRNFLGVV